MPFANARRNHQGEYVPKRQYVPTSGTGKAVFCPCFSLINLWLILPTWWCLLCIRYGLYKNKKCICPYLRLTAETETQFLRNCSQFQAACMKMFLLKLKYYIHLQAFKFSVQAALWIFLFVRCRFDYSYRKRTDVAVCGQRQGGAAPLTPATFEKVD